MRYLFAATLPMLACGGGAAPAPTPVAVVVIAPDTAGYRISARRHVEQVFQGQTIVNEAGTEVWLTLSRAPEPGGFAIRVVVDSAATDGRTDLPAAAVRAAAGAEFVGRTSTLGQVADWPLPEGAGTLLQQAHASLLDLLLSVPESGAAPGVTWSDTTTLTTLAGTIPVLIRTVAVHRAAAAWQDEGARQTLAVATAANYTIIGEGERDGQWLVLQGEGRSHLERLVSVGGAVVGGTRADTLDLEVEVSSAGLTIPVRQIRTDTVQRVLP